jgi:exosortase/archaeosortase family protein
LRFVLLVAGLMIAFNVVVYREFAAGRLSSSYLAANAHATAYLLRVVGEPAVAVGSSIVSSRFSLDVKAGCDAVQPSAFFVFVVLASPVAVSWTRRVSTAVAGTAVLMLLNLARLLTLYYTGVYWKEGFDFVHADVWQAAFILLPLFLWIGWVRRVVRQPVACSNVLA